MNLKMGVTRKQSTANFSKNKHLPPDTHTYVCVSGVRNVLFLENLVWRVVLLPYSRRGFYPMHFCFSYFLFPFLTILWLCCIMHFRVLLPRSPLSKTTIIFCHFLQNDALQYGHYYIKNVFTECCDNQIVFVTQEGSFENNMHPSSLEKWGQ